MANINLTLSKKPLLDKSKKGANTLVKALSILENLQTFNGSLYELAEKIEKGYIIIPSLLKEEVVNSKGVYTRCMANFSSIEVLAIDIDNAEQYTDPITKEQIKIDYLNGDDKHISVDKAKEVLKELGLNYSMIYTTLSHTERQHKFRVVFTLKTPITDVLEAKQVYLNLGFTLNKLGLKVDGRALEPSRLFFPGKVLEIKTNSYLDLSKLKVYEKSKKKEKKIKNINKIIDSETVAITKKSDLTSLKEMSNLSIDDVIEHINSKIKYPLEIDFSDRYIMLNTMIDLLELFNTKEYEKFQCVLPSHIDSDSSAYLYRADNDITVYHCFGCGDRLNPIQFVKSYFNLDEKALFDILEKSTLIKIGSHYQKNVQDMCFKTIMYISDIKGFKRDNEVVFKYLSRRNLTPLLESMYILCGLYVNKAPLIENTEIENSSGFFMAISSLRSYYNSKYNSKLTEDNIRNKVNALANLGLIDKIALSEVRDDVRKNCIAYLNKMKLYKYPNFYLIKPLTMDILKNAERIILLEKELKVKAVNQGKKQSTVVQGDKAKDIYVQNNNDICIEKEPLYKQLIKAIESLDKRYFTLNEILKLVDKKRKYKKSYKQKQIEIYLSKLIFDKKIDRVKGSLANKTKYSIISEEITPYTHVYIIN